MENLCRATGIKMIIVVGGTDVVSVGIAKNWKMQKNI
jgi:hypothetical protein